MPGTNPEMLYTSGSPLLLQIFSELCPQTVVVRHFRPLPPLNLTTALVVCRPRRTFQSLEDLACPNSST